MNRLVIKCIFLLSISNKAQEVSPFYPAKNTGSDLQFHKSNHVF